MVRPSEFDTGQRIEVNRIHVKVFDVFIAYDKLVKLLSVIQCFFFSLSSQICDLTGRALSLIRLTHRRCHLAHLYLWRL
jgi:hypothetical protein